MATIKDLLSKMILRINETHENDIALREAIESLGEVQSLTQEEELMLLTEMDVVTTVADSNNKLYTSNDGKVYVL